MNARLLSGLLIVIMLTLGSLSSCERNEQVNVIIIYLDDMEMVTCH